MTSCLPFFCHRASGQAIEEHKTLLTPETKTRYHHNRVVFVAIAAAAVITAIHIAFLIITGGSEHINVDSIISLAVSTP